MNPASALAAVTLLICGACSALPEDPVEYSAWEVSALASIEEQKNLPPEQFIPALGKWVHKLSLPSHLEKGDRPVYNGARNLLLSIPNHAKWFGDEIKRMTDQGMEGAYHHERGWYFTTLSQLQSPETVKVLGEQLFDERSPFKGPPNDAEWIPSSNLAVSALHKLGLDNPPVKSIYADPRNDLRTWQLWFEQVRAGTRTFSFKGDKTIYSLAGPVAAALEPGGGQSGSPQSAPDSARVSPVGSSNPSVWIALSLAVVALIVAAKFAFARKPA